MSRHPRSLNVVSLTLYLILAVGVYLSYKYLPIVWKKHELEIIVKEHTYGLKGRGNPTSYVQESLIQTAHRQLEIELEPKDIQVSRLAGSVRIGVIWRPVVKFPLNKEFTHQFKIVKETILFSEQ